MNTWILTYDIKYFQHKFRRSQLNLIRLCIILTMFWININVEEIPGTRLKLPLLARVIA